MASIFIGTTRGASPVKHTDFTIGTTTNAGSDFEVRFNTTDQASPTPGVCTRKDFLEALKAFEIVVNSNGIYTTGFLGV